MRRNLLRGALACFIVCAEPATSSAAEAFDQRTTQAIVSAVLRTPEAVELARLGRLRTIRLFPVEEKVAAGQRAEGLAEVVLVSYANGRGLRGVVETRSLRARALPMRGRPQSSEEERLEAEEAIRRNPEVAPLVRAGGYVVGGFAVDPPRGAPPGRYLEYHVGNRDHKALLREVFINMATGKALISQQPGR